MNIPKIAFQTATACSDSVASLWLPAFEAAFDEFGVSNPAYACAILAHVGVESASLTVFAENLNYSAQGLSNTWARYSSTGTRGGPPNALALKLARNPQAIANNVYANRLGNGDEASGDGWNHRGMGPIPIGDIANLILSQVKHIRQEARTPRFNNTRMVGIALLLRRLSGRTRRPDIKRLLIQETKWTLPER
jgi:predicted chitinase